MFIGKNYQLKAGLYLILFMAVLLSCYSLWNYHNSSAAAWSNHMPGPNFHPNAGQVDGRHFTAPDRLRGPGPAGGEMNSSKSASPLCSYAAVFLGLFFAAYYWLIRKNVKLPPEHIKIIIWTLLGLGFFFRLAVAPWVDGFSSDINLFKNWATAAAQSLSEFYSHSSCDYPPFYIYILYLIGKITSVSAVGAYFNLLIKLPSMLADVVSAYLIYKLAAKYLAAEISLLVSAFYIFNPAVMINSTFWGQVDSFFTMLLVLALLMLSSRRIWLSAVFFTTAVLMKPQGIIFLPVFFFELVRLKKVKGFLVAAASALSTALVIILPFSLYQGPLWIFNLYSRTVGEYPYASVNAYNFFSLIGANYKPDTAKLLIFSYHAWGMMFIVLITAFSWLIYIKGHDAKFASMAALLQIAGVFTFSTSMHERYLFPAAALALLAFIYLKDKRILWLAAGFSLTIFINTDAVLYGTLSSSIIMTVTALLNVIFFIYLAKVAWDCATLSHLP